MGPDIDMKFHQEVMEIVSYDISITAVYVFMYVDPLQGSLLKAASKNLCLAFIALKESLEKYLTL